MTEEYVVSRNPVELAKQIRAWERQAGESFTDYYMDDHVKEVSWAFWLLAFDGGRHSDRANYLIDEVTAKQSLGQEEKFHLFYNPEMSWGSTHEEWLAAEEVYLQDFMLWAEFLTASDRYFKDIEDWLTGQHVLYNTPDADYGDDDA